MKSQKDWMQYIEEREISKVFTKAFLIANIKFQNEASINEANSNDNLVTAM